MLPDGAACQADALLLDRLRTATRDAHQGLEDALGLLEPPLRRERFLEALWGFKAFHLAWEPRVEALIGDPELMASRRRSALLEQDLEALAGTAAPGRQPAFDLTFLTTPSAAWGSLYVLEGSALGGQVISAALRTADWLPEGGLAYFNPYGRRTGAMWRGFRTALEMQAPRLDADAVTAGARATFGVLQSGLAPVGSSFA